MLYSTRYALRKAEDSDNADLRVFVNENMDILETEVSRIDDRTISWTDVQEKPLTFSPSEHTHTWTEITDKPTYDNYRGFIVSDNTNTTMINSYEDLTFTGIGETSVSLDPSTRTVTINTESLTGDVTVNSLTTEFIHLNYTGDISPNTSTRGLLIGAIDGQHVTYDSNEIGSFNGTSLSTLHLNPDGGTVSVNINGTSGNSLEVHGRLQTDTMSFSNGNSIYFDVYGNVYGGGGGSWNIRDNQADVILSISTASTYGSGRYFIIDDLGTGGSGGEPTLRPNTSGGYGYIGTSSREFYRGYAYSWVSVSTEDYKDNVVDTDKKLMKDFIKGLRIRQYNSHKNKNLSNSNRTKRVKTRNINNEIVEAVQETEVAVDDKQVGLVIEELDLNNPMTQKILDDELAGVDIYAYTSMLAGALQDTIKEVEILRDEVNKLSNNGNN